MKICVIKATCVILGSPSSYLIKFFIVESVKECNSGKFIHIKCCLKQGSYVVYFSLKKKKKRERSEESLLWILWPDLKHLQCKALDWNSKTEILLQWLCKNLIFLMWLDCLCSHTLLTVIKEIISLFSLQAEWPCTCTSTFVCLTGRIMVFPKLKNW